MLIDHLWTIVGVSLITRLVVYLLRAVGSPMALLPGPWYTTVTGLWLMIQEFQGRRRLYIQGLHERYGSVVRLGPREAAFTSPDAAREIYASAGGAGYDKTALYTLFRQFGIRTLFSTLGKIKHREKKGHIAAQYANSTIMKPEIIRGIQYTSNAFVTHCTLSQGSSIDVYAYLHCYALDCATHFLFYPYRTLSLQNNADRNIMKELSYHDNLRYYLVENRWPLLAGLAARIMKPKLSPLANAYVFNVCRNTDLDESTLQDRLQSSHAFTEREIAAECMDHMAAGIDTTGDALCFLMYEISKPQNIYMQDTLFIELKMRECVTFNDGHDLPYLDALVKEGLRCFPPIPMSQPRHVPKAGRVIDGYYIPEGTIVSCQAWSSHRCNEAVFPDGHNFIPERWLEKEGHKERERAFFAFGIGARGCTGRHLAIAEMKTLLIDVYLRFKTRIAKEMEGDMSVADQIISSRPRGQTCLLNFDAR